MGILVKRRDREADVAHSKHPQYCMVQVAFGSIHPLSEVRLVPAVDVVPDEPHCQLVDHQYCVQYVRGIGILLATKDVHDM